MNLEDCSLKHEALGHNISIKDVKLNNKNVKETKTFIFTMFLRNNQGL